MNLVVFHLSPVRIRSEVLSAQLASKAMASISWCFLLVILLTPEVRSYGKTYHATT